MTKGRDILEMAKDDIHEYGEEVLKDRAIPDFRDGLKPVHRRILWSCYEMGLKSSGGTKKSARVVGDCMGRYHPHGDGSIYQALVGMTDTVAPEPMLYGQGNFGGIEESAAAMRYTEVKLTKFAEKYLLDPNYLALIPMVPNYDDTEKEPAYLPSKLPNLFLFGTEGIAVGCSNNITSFSKDSVVSLVKKALAGEEINGKLLAKTLKFKFTYGGECVSSRKEIRSYFDGGFERLDFASKISDSKKGITIDTLAPRLKPSKLEASFSKMKDLSSADMVHSRKVKHWFELNLKKNADEKAVKERIRRLTTVSLNFQTYVTVRHDDGSVSFKKTSPVGILKDWIDWRLDFEKKVIVRLIGLEQTQVRKYRWLIWASENLKLVMQALESKNPDAFLVKHGKITSEGADFILSQQVRRLARLELAGLKEKKKSHERNLPSLSKDLKSKTRLVDRVVSTL